VNLRFKYTDEKKEVRHMITKKESPYAAPVNKLIEKTEKKGWERRRKGVAAWRCTKCGKPTLVGFKKPKTKKSRMFVIKEVCALCKHETDTRVFDPKTKQFVKGKRRK
jgi:hypothetical protein